MKALIKRPEGRPTKYLPDIIYPKIEEYISGCGREQTLLPTVEGLALYLDVNADTLYEWSNKHPAFSETIKKILMQQKTQLMNDGMYGGKEVNSTMAIFLLKVNHGMNEAPSTLLQVNTQLNNIIPIMGGKSWDKPAQDVHSDNGN